MICYLSIFGGKGNGLEHFFGPPFAIMGVVQLVRVNVVEVGVFFILEVIQVGYLLFHFRVEISTHLFLPLSPLMCLHLLINELGLLHAFQEGHHFGFDHHYYFCHH